MTQPNSDVKPIEWAYNDGGRKAAGFKGTTGDCTCRAIATATGEPYQVIYDELNALGKLEQKSKRRNGKSSARTGVYKSTIKRYLASKGFIWVPTMGIGTGCTVHLKERELPMGRLVVSVSKHTTAVIDGILHDTYDCSRDGTRCVYGYWKEP